MRVLSLFSGIGAHDLGLVWSGMEIVGQVEIDDYCRSILTKHWPDVPKWTDITKVSVDDIRSACGHIDLITGGFPCQDISSAGKGAGINGARSGLFWEMLRIIEGIKPTWVLIENSPALRTRGSDAVLDALEQCGYTVEPLVVCAEQAGAPHIRYRVVLVGHSNRHAESAGTMGRRKDLVGATASGTQSGSDDQLGDTVGLGRDTFGSESARQQRQIVSNGPDKSCQLRDTDDHRCDGSSISTDSDSHLFEIDGSNKQDACIFDASIEGLQGQRQGLSSLSAISNTDSGSVWKQPRRKCGTCGSTSFFPGKLGIEVDHRHDWEYPFGIKPGMGWATDGTSRRVAIHAIGNIGLPPQLMAAIGRVVMSIHQEYVA